MRGLQWFGSQKNASNRRRRRRTQFAYWAQRKAKKRLLSPMNANPRGEGGDRRDRRGDGGAHVHGASAGGGTTHLLLRRQMGGAVHPPVPRRGGGPAVDGVGGAASAQGAARRGRRGLHAASAFAVAVARPSRRRVRLPRGPADGGARRRSGGRSRRGRRREER
jgi:hypothetical protein